MVEVLVGPLHCRGKTDGIWSGRPL